ncbi:unnamed protein product [Bursaphelenchus okinawaensis]|uniref:Myosin motor domain-containing protein n=1 Tax=Bursaphelenchus okinawaensis TaxID=465554 RepID=A0A811JSV9_9BILA|nr:unnamed protein product [Bursaphelenchus okinawaensis]CAG9081722.1 unnamed protein product [Bursaphelenchus okinawaensis]
MNPVLESTLEKEENVQLQHDDVASMVQAVSNDFLDFNKPVFVPDDVDGYIRGRIVDVLADSLVVKCDDKTVTLPFSKVLPCEESCDKSVDDNCMLMYLNEGTLLENCKLRYHQKQIYTYVANILISINPYENLTDLYSLERIAKYRGKSLGTLPPHVFAIADKAYRDMRRCKESQSIIVSGESGAGKTESQKCILKYLCENWCAPGSKSLEEHVLETNPILEAFGNAKTLRNNNSSRFGKFIEIHFQENGMVAGGHVSHYLLEKSRICIQQREERNYHIFYQLFVGADESLRKDLGLTTPQDFEFLKHGFTKYFTNGEATGDKVYDEVVNDAEDFQRLSKALKNIGYDENSLLNLFKLLAGILHLGNIVFEESDDIRGGCKITSASEFSADWAAKLMGIGKHELVNGLVSRIMQPTRGGIKGTVIQVRLKSKEAAATRDTLAKTIYGKLFDAIVAKINACFPIQGSKNFIGVLDIAGFEFFKNNSFEQFCINYCNEKLQEFFNDRILKQEQELYVAESLNIPQIEYNDNHDCIELFESKGGLLDLLDEEIRLPKPTTQHFTTSVHQTHGSHFRLSSSRNSKVKEYRALREDECFIIRHFAGSVCYQTSQFIEKNSNNLHASLENMISFSSNQILTQLFEASTLNKPQNKLISSSASALFRKQLGSLLDKLQRTGTHFVRCIKPNGEMSPGKFESNQILGQLRYSGMESVLKLMQMGYPSRTQFSELYNMYSSLLPEKLARLDHRLFCKCLFHVLGLNDSDYKFGMTKVFFKPGKFAEFDQLLRHDPQAMKEMIGKVQSWLCKLRWRKVQYGIWSCIKLEKKIAFRAANVIMIQSVVRGFIAKRKVFPRVKLATTVSNIIKDVDNTMKMLASNEDMDSELLQQLTLHKNVVAATLRSLKDNVNSYIQPSDKDTVSRLQSDTTKLIEDVKKAAAEKESLKRQLMELEKKRLEEIQKAKQREEHEKRRLEALRKIQEQMKAEEEQRKAAEQRQLAEKAKREEKERQEQLDLELAKRLEQENGVHLAEDANKQAAPKPKDENDLTQWTYAKLRDTINTTSDIELISACRSEFHRRLRVYQNWKKTHARKQT